MNIFDLLYWQCPSFYHKRLVRNNRPLTLELLREIMQVSPVLLGLISLNEDINMVRSNFYSMNLNSILT